MRMAPALFVMLVLTLAAACSGASKPKATPAPKLSAGASSPAPALVTPSPTPADGLPQPLVLKPGDPVPFPQGVVVYARDPVWEGPTNAIRRYYRSPDGIFHDEILLQSIWSEDDEQTRAISSAAWSSSGSDLAVTLCHGTCYGGWQPITVAASRDGGITWDSLGDRADGGWVQATQAGSALLGTPETRGTGNLVELPGGVTFPVDGYKANDEIRTLQGSSGLQLTLWQYGERTVRQAASSLPLTSLPVPQQYQIFGVSPIPAADHSLRLWVYFGVVDGAEHYEGVLDPATSHWQYLFKLSQESGITSLWISGWLDSHTAVARASFMRSAVGASPPDWDTGLPALVDVRTGVVSPIEEFLSFAPGKAGGPAPFAIAKGTFLQVTGAGDCLNVRSEPGLTAPVVHCYADRVLLARESGQRSADGVTWQEVRLPTGEHGWASSEFLALATSTLP